MAEGIIVYHLVENSNKLVGSDEVHSAGTLGLLTNTVKANVSMTFWLEKSLQDPHCTA